MAYEYEGRISNSIDRDKNYFFTTTSKDMKDELQEVYRKAKAMDEILNIDLAQHDEEYADNVMKVVNKYTEDKQND